MLEKEDTDDAAWGRHSQRVLGLSPLKKRTERMAEAPHDVRSASRNKVQGAGCVIARWLSSFMRHDVEWFPKANPSMACHE